MGRCEDPPLTRHMHMGKVRFKTRIYDQSELIGTQRYNRQPHSVPIV